VETISLSTFISPVKQPCANPDQKTSSRKKKNNKKYEAKRNRLASLLNNNTHSSQMSVRGCRSSLNSAVLGSLTFLLLPETHFCSDNNLRRHHHRADTTRSTTTTVVLLFSSPDP
jgi:hypothetical protein